ncbi:hypothetical protein [uncultured Ilyobacter sp.]|uniref:hypothetical protein n=1 Tax=uncultured Ilyobacter sp. TaxID=544433 RepID=UPI0029C87D10|nr:hypothetical protein [uncultured Ilyobacter sp.]
MKKRMLILFGILLLLTVAYADNYGEKYTERDYYGDHMMYGRYYDGNMTESGYRGHMMGGYGYHRGMYEDVMYIPQRRLTPEEEKAFLKMREEHLKIYNQYGRAIARKQLEVEMELLKDNIDWKKIQKLNDEIGLLESKLKTELMKKNYIKEDLK